MEGLALAGPPHALLGGRAAVATEGFQWKVPTRQRDLSHELTERYASRVVALDDWLEHRSAWVDAGP